MTGASALDQVANVWFVWYNSASQVAKIGERIGVTFVADQTLTFANTYDVPETYAVKVFISDAIDNSIILIPPTGIFLNVITRDSW